MTERQVIPIHGGDHCPGGPDPIPCLESSPTVWAALSNQVLGWVYEGAGGDDDVDWDTIFISTQGESYFGVEVVEGGGQFGDDIGFLTATQSGIYTFTQQFLTSSLAGPTGSLQAFNYQTRLNVLGGTPGTSWGGTTDCFPGQFAAIPLLQDREQLWIASNTGDDLWLNRSWTIPLRHPSPGNERRMGEMRLFHTAQGFDVPWDVRLWIVRHGDLDWPQADDFDATNRTWTTGDPEP